jgi:hypothetical protein
LVSDFENKSERGFEDTGELSDGVKRKNFNWRLIVIL